jgi:hypothetical protein
MNNHKVTVAKSLSYENAYEVRCTCGFYKSISKTNLYTSSLAKVRAEARYIKLDHIEDAKELVGA